MKTRVSAGRDGAVSPEARRTVRCRVLWPSWLLFAALALLFTPGLAVPEWLQYVPFALSLVLFGLPHGAVDHLAVPRLLSKRAWPGPALAVGLLYLVLGGSYLALWFATPFLAFALFLALTWFHWGAGDLYALAAFSPDGTGYPESYARAGLALLARGGLPMLVPLLASPDEYRAVAGGVVGLFGATEPGYLSWVFGEPFRLVAGAGFAALLIASLVLGRREGSGSVWRMEVAETAILALYFAFVPPVLAVGLYFCLWHAPRHVARLVLLDKKGSAALSAGRVAPAFLGFMRDAAPLTGVALLLLAGLYLLAPGAGASPLALLALYLVLISILTLPHVVVVAWMDYRQGLWTPPGAEG